MTSAVEEKQTTPEEGQEMIPIKESDYGCQILLEKTTIEKAEDNSTFVVRKFIKDSHFLDIYTSNAYSLIDMGQLQKSSSQKYGIRFGKFF